jgi:hypothetical protein
MPCKKCNYKEKKGIKIFGSSLCKVCATFAPIKIHNFQNYIAEKVDWKVLDTFRIHGQTPGTKQKRGMQKMAQTGKPQTRPPLGYSIVDGNLTLNEDLIKVRLLFKTFLKENYSLNFLAKKFSLSINGLKKILTNRTYLGEIKFDSKIYKGNHPTLISPEIFYTVQRKLKDYLVPKK